MMVCSITYRMLAERTVESAVYRRVRALAARATLACQALSYRIQHLVAWISEGQYASMNFSFLTDEATQETLGERGAQR